MSPRAGPDEAIRSLDAILGVRGSIDYGSQAGWLIVLPMVTAPDLRRDRQVVRLLAFLKLLKENGHPSVHDLAARFHTRRETIYRAGQVSRRGREVPQPRIPS
jgi:hypothetical protein